MLKFVPGHFKSQKMFRNSVKKWSLAIMHVPDQYKTREICTKVILKISEML